MKFTLTRTYRAKYNSVDNKLTFRDREYLIDVWSEGEKIYVQLEGFLRRYDIHEFLKEWKIIELAQARINLCKDTVPDYRTCQNN